MCRVWCVLVTFHNADILQSVVRLHGSCFFCQRKKSQFSFGQCHVSGLAAHKKNTCQDIWQHGQKPYFDVGERHIYTKHELLTYIKVRFLPIFGKYPWPVFENILDHVWQDVWRLAVGRIFGLLVASQLFERGASSSPTKTENSCTTAFARRHRPKIRVHNCTTTTFFLLGGFGSVLVHWV